MTKHHVDVIYDEGEPDKFAELLGAYSKNPTINFRIYALAQALADNGFQYLPDGTVRFIDPNKSCCHDAQYVLSRVVNVSQRTVGTLSEGRAGLYKGCVSKGLELLMQSYTNAIPHCGLYSTAGTVLSLPTQYALVKRSNLVDTPNFVYASGYESIDDARASFDNAIIKSPFDLYHWKTGTHESTAQDRFCIERPRGDPVVSYAVRGHSWHYTQSPNKARFDALPGVLDELAQQLLDIFGGSILEILWFIDGHSVTYACASQYCRSLSTLDQITGFEEYILGMGRSSAMSKGATAPMVGGSAGI